MRYIFDEVFHFIEDISSFFIKGWAISFAGAVGECFWGKTWEEFGNLFPGYEYWGWRKILWFLSFSFLFHVTNLKVCFSRPHKKRLGPSRETLLAFILDRPSPSLSIECMSTLGHHPPCRGHLPAQLTKWPSTVTCDSWISIQCWNQSTQLFVPSSY